MNLYIMSRGRAKKVNTLRWIPKHWRKQTYLIVPKNELTDYYHANRHLDCGFIAAPNYVTNYSQKFQWLLDGLPDTGGVRADSEAKAVILDDDLVFSMRSTEDGKLRTVRDAEQLDGLWEHVERLLEQFPLVGVHPRQQGHLTAPPFVYNGRIICIQGINRDIIGATKVDDLPILADVILNCTLLSRGLANVLITTHFQDHGPCQAEGGCSVYRTPEMQKRAAEYIAARWHPFAKTVLRRPKVAKWFGDERTEFTVQWKKLYEHGKRNPGSIGALDPNALRRFYEEGERAVQAVDGG